MRYSKKFMEKHNFPPIELEVVGQNETQYKVKTHSGRTYWMNKEDVE